MDSQTRFFRRSSYLEKKVTILEDGIRSNENNITFRTSLPILAVGDSFTFGDQVANNETWSSRLEKRIQKPVINAGVFAYGLDQSFLRLKFLIPKYKPDIIIFGLIPDDIYRCEYATTFGANKPYFSIVHNTLTLRGVPVKNHSNPTSFISQTAGYSYVVHLIMMKLNPTWWLSGGYAINERPTGYRGRDIACLLFKELEKIVQQNHVRTSYILVQDTNPSTSHADVDTILSCINRDVFHVIDMRKILSEIKTKDRLQYDSFFNIHMTASGNQFVADILLENMQQHGMANVMNSENKLTLRKTHE